MFFSTTAPSLSRRHAFLAEGRPLERALDEVAQRRMQPVTSIEQDDTSYTLRFDVPGISREQLSIGIEGQVVRIASLDEAPRAYKAAFELPTAIEVATSTAKLENGVLTVHLIKQVPVSKVSQLAIN